VLELNTPLLHLSERALDVATARQTVIANNMANIDTPGYHARDVDFGSELQRALSGPPNGTETTVASRSVPGLIERPDGNNVSMEREGLLSAQTQLQFDTAVQVIRSEFKRFQMAIQEQ
jgi:flagellar basal-body rod protein FlgB